MKRIIIGFIMISVLLLAGCIKIPIGDGEHIKLSKDGFTFSNKDGEEVNVSLDEDEENFSITGTSDGKDVDMSFGTGTELPDNFPKDIPITDDATIIMAYANDSDADLSEEGSLVSYVSEKNFTEIVAMYEKFFETSNFTLESSTEEDRQEALEEMSEEFGDDEVGQAFGELFDSIMGFTGSDGESRVHITIMKGGDEEEDGASVQIMYGKAGADE